MPKEAVTEYVVLKSFPSATLLEVYPKTGRMHQIRVQFAFLGHPIAGDAVYGGKRVCFRELGRYFLHSSSLSFSLHEGQVLSFSAELPEELKRVLDALSGYY
jgi:23S rRNA pseudouridine1911/1915/1917 synthase